jgi:hypothetical protein
MLLLPRRELEDVSENQMNSWLENTLSPLEQLLPVQLIESKVEETTPEPATITPMVVSTDTILNPEEEHIETDPPRVVQEDKKEHQDATVTKHSEVNAEEDEHILLPTRADQDLPVERLKRERKHATGRQFLVKFKDGEFPGTILKAWKGHVAKATPLLNGMYFIKWYDCWTPEQDVGSTLVNEWDAEKQRPKKRRRRRRGW